MASIGRPLNPDRKEELLDDLVSYFAAGHGLSEVTMRPLSEWMGVSPFTLTYQFRSKEQMLDAVIDHVLNKQAEAVDAAAADDVGALGRLRSMWLWGSNNRELIRMLLEAAALPWRFGDKMRQAADQQIRLLASEFDVAGDPDGSIRLAANAHAALAGLFADLVLFDDSKRTYTKFADLLGRVVDELSRLVDNRQAVS